MNELLLILVPLVAAGLAALWPTDRTRPWFLPAAGLAHVLLAFGLLLRPPEVPFHPWLGYDPLARAMLPAISLLFLGCAFYGVPYLRLRAERPNRVFVASFLAALGLMSAAHMARHLGVLWLAPLMPRRALGCYIATVFRWGVTVCPLLVIRLMFL